MIAGTLCDAVARDDAVAPIPALVALSYLVSLLAFFTAFANPLADSSLSQSRPLELTALHDAEAIGVASVLVYAALLTGTVLAARHWRVPPGGFTLLLTVSSALTLLIHECFWLLPAAVLAGALADGLVAWLRPSGERVRALRRFGALVPVAFFGLYFAALGLTVGRTED